MLICPINNRLKTIMDSNRDVSHSGRLKRWRKVIWKFCTPYSIQDDVTAAEEKNMVTFVAECTSKTEDNKETAVGGFENLHPVEGLNTKEKRNEQSIIVYTRSYLLKFERMAICQTVPEVLANWSILKKLSPSSALRETVIASNWNNSNRRQHNQIYRNAYNRAGQHFQKKTVAALNWNNSNRRPHNQIYRNAYNRARQHFQTKIAVASCGNNADKRPHNSKYRNGYDRERENFQMQPGNSIRSDRERETAKKTIHIQLSLNSETKLDTIKNAWVSAIAARNAQTATDGISVAAVSNIEWNTTEELNKKVRSILNKITPENIDDMIRSFVELPINTFERLENAAVMVFEKAIREQNFASVYAKLCSVDMCVIVADKETISFKGLIIKMCKSLFESGKSRTVDSLNKLQDINLCKDPEKKKQLKCEHEDEERRSRKRFVANCCFIGELFKEEIIDSKLVENYITYLVDQRSDEPTECLCNLLRTSGNEIEQRCDLNDTFVKLECFMSMKCMSSRIRFMVQDIVELKRKKLSTNCRPHGNEIFA